MIKISCHDCDEWHDFPEEYNGYHYTCSNGGAHRYHLPINKLHKLTDGTYADPEQWYKFTEQEWGDYNVNTNQYSK